MNDETERLAEQCDAASRDDRLADGMLYRDAARHMRALRSKLDEARGLFKGHQRDGCDPCKLMQRCFDAENENIELRRERDLARAYIEKYPLPDFALLGKHATAEVIRRREARIVELEKENKILKDKIAEFIYEETGGGYEPERW